MPLTLGRWHFALKDAAGKLSLDRDVAMPGPIERSTNSLHEFYHSFVLPRDFQKGSLHIEGEVDLDGRRIPLSGGTGGQSAGSACLSAGATGSAETQRRAANAPPGVVTVVKPDLRERLCGST